MSEPTPVQRSSGTETSISPALMELNLKKETLLLRKLELDNDEQQARIAQLQLQWWQKPKLLITITASALTFAGFLVNNVVQDGINKATIQKQKNELENQRLEFEKQRLAPRVEQLQQAEKELINTSLKRYADVCEIGGRIAASETTDAAKAIVDDFDKLPAIEAQFDEPIVQIKKVVGDLQVNQPMTELEKVRVGASVLALSYSCKAAFEKKYAKQFPQAVRNLAIAIYAEAIVVAKDLRASTDRTDATSAIERFLRLYYGRLVLIETAGVSGAMVKTNEKLLQWTSGPPDRVVLDRLIDTLQTESEHLAKQHDDDLLPREMSVETKPIPVSPPISQ